MSNDIKDGGPAFPHEYKFGDGAASRAEGMSLRDWLAGQALNGLIVSRAGPMGCQHWRDWADQAYRFADAMLRARGQS